MPSFTQTFPLTASSGPAVGPASSSTFITADFTNTAINQTVSKFVWGVASGQMSVNVPFNTSGRPFGRMGDNTLVNAFAPLQYPLWRFNSASAVSQGITQWMEVAFPGGAITASDAQLDFAFGLLIDNFPRFAPADARIILGMGGDPVNFWSSASRYASACVRAVQYIMGRNSTATGQPITPMLYGFEVGNELDAQGGSPTAPLYQYTVAMARALRAISTNFHICGPTFTYFHDYNNLAIAGNNPNDPTGNDIQVIDAHSYSYGNVPPGDPSGANFNDKGGLTSILAGGNLRGGLSGVNQLWQASGGPASVELFVGEYNQNQSPSSIADNPANVYQVNYAAALFIANAMMECIFNDKNFTMAAIWSALYDADYGMVGAQDVAGGGNNVSPGGKFLAKAASQIFGTRVSCITGSALSGFGTIKVMAVKPAPDRLALIVTNFSQSSNISGPIALSHWPLDSTGTGTITRWEIGINNPNPVTSSLAVTNGVTASVTIPQQSVVILHN